MAYPDLLRHKVGVKRRAGASIIDIAREFGLAKSTVSLWVRDVELPALIRKHLKANSEKGCELGRMVMAARRKTQAEFDDKEAEGAVAGLVSGADKDFWRLVVALLYWGEGEKGLSRPLGFSNSDPEMVRTYMRALRSAFEINELKFRVTVHLHEYHNVREQHVFWSSVTGIPTTHFSKPYIKPHTGNQKRLGYPGCVNVRYGDVRIAKKVKALYHAFANI